MITHSSLALLALAAASPGAASGADHPRVQGPIPLSFEANGGQLASEVRFRASARGVQVELHAGGVVVASGGDAGPSAVRIELLGADADACPAGEAPLGHRTNYLRGADPRGWVKGVRHYARVRYERVLPGTDLVWHATEDRLKYELELAPGVDPAPIRLRYSGVEALEVDAEGRLVARTELGTLVEEAPIAYQESAAGRCEVPARWRLVDERTAEFELAGVDASLPLVIDPYLDFSTYLGGNQYDSAYAVAVDPAGAVYVTGITRAPDFPVTNGSTPSGEDDVFVAKLDVSGGLVYATYIGGSGEDEAWGIDVDSSGRATIAGWTVGGGFPVTNPIAGDSDAFVARLAPDGASLEMAVAIGGSLLDRAWDVALDPQGNAYVVGGTASNDFPVLQPYQATLLGAGFFPDVFLTKVAPSGALVYSTYLGSSGFDQSYAVAVDDLGRAVVAGGCGSVDFAVDPGAADTVFSGSPIYGEGFVVRFAANDGSVPLTRELATFLGGSGSGAEYPVDVAIGSDGSIYTASVTSSADFPGVAGSFDPVLTGTVDCAVTRISADGTTILYSTYLGGPDGVEGTSFDLSERGWGIAVDDQGRAWVAGQTPSAAFPLREAGDVTYNGLLDGFLAAISPDGTQLLYGSYLGSRQPDVAYDVAVDGNGRIVVVGETGYDYVFPIHDAFDDVHNSHGPDAFVSRLQSVAHPFVRGDANHDGAVDISDAILVLNYIYGYVGDNDQISLDAADANDSGAIDIADPIYLLFYLTSGGPPPAAPFPGCGTDPTPDALGLFVTDC